VTAARAIALCLAIGLALTSGQTKERPPDPFPDPRSVAQDTPAFVAPEKPPRPDDAEQPTEPEPAAPLALQDALALALMRNSELEIFSWDVRSSEARTLQAGKLPNPQLDFRVYRLGIPRASADPDDSRSRVILSQVLQIGGKRRREVLVGQAESQLAGWDYEAKRIEVATTVAGHFVAVLGAQRRVESNRRFVESLERIQEDVTKLVETGAMRALETHQVARQVGLARIDLQRAESQLAVTRFRLAATWSNQSPRFTEAVGDLEQVVTVPDIDVVIELAQSSPAIARWDTEFERGQAAVALAKSRRVPDITVGAGMRWQDNIDERDYLLDVGIGLPIFDRKQGEIREAQFNMARAKAAKESAEAMSRELIAEFYYQMTESRAVSLTMAEEVVPSALAAVESLSRAVEVEPARMGDLLDARRDLARAEVNYTDALVDYHQALAGLEGIVGRSLSGTE
jgi:cobalt-zinc-cadmium efflux system outer membrane protein